MIKCHLPWRNSSTTKKISLIQTIKIWIQWSPSSKTTRWMLATPLMKWSTNLRFNPSKSMNSQRITKLNKSVQKQTLTKPINRLPAMVAEFRRLLVFSINVVCCQTFISVRSVRTSKSTHTHSWRSRIQVLQAKLVFKRSMIPMILTLFLKNSFTAILIQRLKMVKRAKSVKTGS